MAITLGNFFSSNGRTVLGGLGGSGLDTESLINGLVEAKTLPKLKLEDKVTLNNNKITAYGKLRTLMATLKDAANFLRNPPGVGNEADNVFKYRTANVSSNTSVAASNYVNVAVEPGTLAQTYNITEITSLARAKKQRTGSFAIASVNTSVVTTAATAGFFKAGTVAINGANLTLDADDTLSEVAAKFNTISADTGITASIIQAGDNDFRLVFTATSAGTAADFDLNPPSGAVPADASGVFSMIGRTNLLSNGTFDTDIASWTDASLGTGVVAHDGAGSMQLDGDGAGGNEAFAQQAMTTSIGQQYTVRTTLTGLAGSAYIRIGTDSDVSNPNNFDVSDYEVAADGTVEFTFTATSTTTYLTINSDSNTDPFTVDNISVVSNATAAFSDTQVASDAEFTIDGVTVIRDSNSITDVVDGVTINLLATTPALTELEIDIVEDTELPRSGVLNFINAFNALRVFAAEQSEVNDDGTFAETAYLSNDTLLKNTLSNIATELSRVVSGSQFSSLAEVGVTFSDLPKTENNPFTRNVLTINEDKLATALADSFDAVEALFGFTFTSSNANLQIYSRTNALDADDFTVNVDPNTETYTATVDGQVYNLTPTSLGVSGYTLTGQAGTPLEGLVMIYGATTAGSSTVTVSQGIADRLYNLAGNLLDEQEGALQTQINAVESSITRYETEMERINEQVAKFRDQLLKRFGALEATLSSVNALLNSLDAQQAARNNASN